VRTLGGGVTLVVAAVYELTPLKDVCLGKCRSPLGFLLGSWRDGKLGGLTMGLRHGGWCIGCCWALMASLFALGVMSLLWMAMVAGLIAREAVPGAAPRPTGRRGAVAAGRAHARAPDNRASRSRWAAMPEM
jgi:predicted metal-binding membrane protein